MYDFTAFNCKLQYFIVNNHQRNTLLAAIFP